MYRIFFSILLVNNVGNKIVHRKSCIPSCPCIKFYAAIFGLGGFREKSSISIKFSSSRRNKGAIPKRPQLQDTKYMRLYNRKTKEKSNHRKKHANGE